MIKKIRQNKGETLVETLVSMLIAVLSVILLATAVMASTKMNAQTKEMDKTYQTQLKQVEGLEDSVQKQKVMLSITFGSKDGGTIYESTTAEVLLYGNDESQFLSYDYEPEGDMP